MLDHIYKYREESEKKRRKREGGGGGGSRNATRRFILQKIENDLRLDWPGGSNATLLERSHIVTDVTSICHAQNAVTYGDKGCFLLCVKTEF